MLLFLMGTTTGAAYAVPVSGITDVEITQQSETCTIFHHTGTSFTLLCDFYQCVYSFLKIIGTVENKKKKSSANCFYFPYLHIHSVCLLF